MGLSLNQKVQEQESTEKQSIENEKMEMMRIGVDRGKVKVPGDESSDKWTKESGIYRNRRIRGVKNIWREWVTSKSNERVKLEGEGKADIRVERVIDVYKIGGCIIQSSFSSPSSMKWNTWMNDVDRKERESKQSWRACVDGD